MPEQHCWNQTCRPRPHFPYDEGVVMAVMIGVDPHKGSHTAVAVDETEQSLGELRVRSGPAQLDRLLGWAGRFPERTWAVENATGLATWWPSSWWRPASGWWTSSPSWLPGCGCWRPRPPTRTIPTTPARWPSP